ncbi:ankyrin repeat domain-containing protein [Rickettsiales endosymbiont of Stachyamoeba lipophora]|uniref:ankyrin repeat domain-containing protein n=1 Tax=Rickettsiales endosymbiont of Stachyamoeba lipophora TaxID=2486578 RepID=UPI000F64D38D|nr:ankyrin repeat domain-containing protein [Rickettsiales endosymbiont of Stachyamoeba lipophora]AZL15595.1 ankyrin repeat domain-containing protein [Rickettsiales endosymbiont of Stachyamoeba lipophora]
MTNSSTQQELQNQLFKAVKDGNIERTKKLLEEGVNPNVRIIKTITYKSSIELPREIISRDVFSNLLSNTLNNNQNEIAKLLIKHGATLYNSDTLEALLNSIDNEVLTYALENKFLNPNQENTFIIPSAFASANFINSINMDSTAAKETLLTYAIKNKTSDKVKLLLEYGADPLKANSKGEALDSLQEKANINLDLPIDDHGNTFLHKLALNKYWNYPNKLKFLLEHGASLEVKNKEGKTPIFYAKDQFVANTLVSQGANILASDNKGKTPVDYCLETEQGYDKLNGVFRSHVKDSRIDNYIELYRAIESKNINNVAYLLKDGWVYPGMNIAKEGLTGMALTEACKVGDVAMLKFLVGQQGLDVNTTFSNYTSVLEYVIKELKASPVIIEILLDNGANPNFVDSNNETPLTLAAKAKDVEYQEQVVKLLVDKGAKIDLPANQDNQVLQSFINNHADLFKVESFHIQSELNGLVNIINLGSNGDNHQTAEIQQVEQLTEINSGYSL